jgi:hypothetical protein
MSQTKKRKTRKKSTRKSYKSDTIKKEQKRTQEKQELFIQEYPKKLCNVAATCRAIGISRDTFYDWQQKFPEFKKQCADAREELIDKLESQAYINCFNGSDKMLIFVLCNIAKERGWSNRHMLEGGDPNKPVRVVVQGVDLSKYPQQQETEDTKK